PVPTGPGDAVYTGTRNGEGALTVRVTAVAGRRRVDDLARSVRALLTRKSGLQRLADRAARRLLPVVAVAASVTGVAGVPGGLDSIETLTRVLAVVVVTCPCALSLAIPVVTLLAELRARGLGCLFRDPAAIEQAAA